MTAWPSNLHLGETKERMLPQGRPTMQDIAWAAGVYEGEGHVRAKGTNIIYVSQKDPWLPERLKYLFGGSIITYNGVWMKNGVPNKQYRWQASGTIARGFLYTIFTFLSPRRREQVRSALCQTQK